MWFIKRAQSVASLLPHLDTLRITFTENGHGAYTIGAPQGCREVEHPIFWALAWVKALLASRVSLLDMHVCASNSLSDKAESLVCMRNGRVNALPYFTCPEEFPFPCEYPDEVVGIRHKQNNRTR